jgi:hypothetical protein
MNSTFLRNVDARKCDLFAWFWLPWQRIAAHPPLISCRLRATFSRKFLEVMPGWKGNSFMPVPSRVSPMTRIHNRKWRALFCLKDWMRSSSQSSRSGHVQPQGNQTTGPLNPTTGPRTLLSAFQGNHRNSM